MSCRNTSLSMRRKHMAITATNRSSSSGGNGKGPSCSTPEAHRGAVSPCNSDSDAASPVPFLCTQDGSYGDTEVVWNYDTPRADRATKSNGNQNTPLSRKSRKMKPKNHIGQLQQPRKKPARDTDKKSQLYQDMLELNKNIQGLIERTRCKASEPIENKERLSSSEEDIFNSSGDRSPKHDSYARSHCLRRNVLSSKFKCEPEAALESDDSMNECLMRASQMIEERVFCKRNGAEDLDDASIKKCKIEQDSMDAVFNNINLESPGVNVRKNASVVNDSFDHFVGNLNDSALERLTQLPIINESPTTNKPEGKSVKFQIESPANSAHHGDSSGWTIKELIALDSVPSLKSSLSRHKSMPESPSVTRAAVKPSTSGTALSRHSSMPWSHAKGEKPTGSSSEDSTPLRCTPEEIIRKHQQAREKLLAKRLFPGSTQQSQSHTQKDIFSAQTRQVPKFQPKVPMNNTQHNKKPAAPSGPSEERRAIKAEMTTVDSNGADLKSIIERKRKEAMNKLKMKRSHYSAL